MSASPPFSLTNEQRKYLALTPIDESWDVVQLKDNIYLYFEGNILRKSITVSEKTYLENELNRMTSDGRTMLPPLTERGKPQKLNYTSFQSINPEGTYFRWACGNNEISIANYTNQRTYYTTYGSKTEYKTWEDVQKWLLQWIEDTTDNDLADIKHFSNAKRQNVKLKEGDFFVFKIGRREYGFGRILMDVRKLRKDVKSGNVKEVHYGLTRLMTQPLMVKVYRKISDTPVADLEELSATPTFLSQQIMDNRLFYGEYPVIGNLPLRADELEFPISIDRCMPNNKEKAIYFQYGLIFFITPLDDYLSYCESLREKGLQVKKTGGYSCNSIGAGLRVMQNIPAMKEAIQTGAFLEESVLSFTESSIGKPELIPDLRHPALYELKKAIFDYFGLDATKSYWENYEIYLNKKS